jgi:hypothetical protein
MTPKEKAKELFDKIYKLDNRAWYDTAKQCALIAVDELIESHLVLTTTHDVKTSIRCKRYWQEVKQEILAL